MSVTLTDKEVEKINEFLEAIRLMLEEPINGAAPTSEAKIIPPAKTKVIPSPISPDTLLHVIQAAELELGLNQSQAAERFLLAIAVQETDLKWNEQVLKDGTAGPAKGRWQFERMGGVDGVLSHERTRVHARALLERRGIPVQTTPAWLALVKDDQLAAAFARLLVLSDPRPLPISIVEGWEYYIRNWRPGKPHPEKWARAWNIATKTVYGA